jgi:hypothetical protein
MGARFLQSIVRPNTDFPAGAFATIDLPVNPLSLLLLNFELTNAADGAAAIESAVDDLLTNVTSVIIKHKGENIISGTLRDLVAVNAIVGGRFPGWDRMNSRTGQIRRVTVPLGFGRKSYNPEECFPATSRGNLTLDITRAANPAAYTDLNLTVEAVELIEANPARYLKYTPQSQTAVVGQFDQALPIGNPYVGLIFFDTGIATLDTGLSSWGQVKLLKDNIEQYYPLSDAQTLAGMMNMRMYQAFPEWGHVHATIDAIAAGALTSDFKTPVSQGLRGYFAMDFDPNGDDMYLMETQGAADIKLRAVGTSATAVRVTPVELVSVKR